MTTKLRFGCRSLTLDDLQAKNIVADGIQSGDTFYIDEDEWVFWQHGEDTLIWDTTTIPNQWAPFKPITRAPNSGTGST